MNPVSFHFYYQLGLLTEEERNVLEDPHKTDPTTPRPLVVIDCKIHAAIIIIACEILTWLTYICLIIQFVIHKGILLLLKETFLQERFFMDFNYLKNVDILMAYKKSCGNTIKFANQNISPALVQVRSWTEPLPFSSFFWSSFPPFYCYQAVILAVYCFGCVTVMARTFTKEEEAPTSHVLIAYVPLMPAMQVICDINWEWFIDIIALEYFWLFWQTQFFIYFSWLCFGKAAVDPFGDDEDDINVKDLVKSHIEVINCFQFSSTTISLITTVHNLAF